MILGFIGTRQLRLTGAQCRTKYIRRQVPHASIQDARIRVPHAGHCVCHLQCNTNINLGHTKTHHTREHRKND